MDLSQVVILKQHIFWPNYPPLEKAKASTATTKIKAHLTQFMLYIRGLKKAQISSEKRSISSNKNFFPSSSPISSIYVVESNQVFSLSCRATARNVFIPGMSSYRHENRACWEVSIHFVITCGEKSDHFQENIVTVLKHPREYILFTYALKRWFRLRR